MEAVYSRLRGGCTEEMHQIYRGRYVVIIQRCQRLTAIGVYPMLYSFVFV